MKILKLSGLFLKEVLGGSSQKIMANLMKEVYEKHRCELLDKILAKSFLKKFLGKKYLEKVADACL